MTDYVHFPEFQITLPEGGKVTGSARLVVRGETALVMTTGSGQAITSPTGKEYSVSLELVRDGEGVVSPTEERGSRGLYTAFTGPWEEGFKDSPKTHAEAMAKALIEQAQEIWTDEVAAQGEYATASQVLHRAEQEFAEAEAVFKQARETRAKAQRRWDTSLHSLVEVATKEEV